MREIVLAVSLWLAAFTLWLPFNYVLGYFGISWSRWGYSVQGVNVVPVAVWALDAAFFEEAFFRGYALTRLPKLIKSTAAPVAVSVFAFAAIHLRFGLALFIYMIVWATIISVLFMITRSTGSCLLYHAANNIGIKTFS